MANYYAQIAPTLERRAELVNMILTSHRYGEIVKEINKTFGLYGVDISGKPKANGGIIHLGKTTIPNGRFLWNPNIFFFNELTTSQFDNVSVENTKVKPYMTYRLTREGITTFINRPDLTVFTEYGEWVDKDDFLKMSLEYDDFDTEEMEKEYKLEYPDENYMKELKKLGFNTKKNSSIFYSDGLMFLACTDFS